MKKYEVISIEPTNLGKHWVITYQTADGHIEKESVEALDSHKAFIVFRNQMIQQAKAKVIRPTK
jgi:hypothetical protein